MNQDSDADYEDGPSPRLYWFLCLPMAICELLACVAALIIIFTGVRIPETCRAVADVHKNDDWEEVFPYLIYWQLIKFGCVALLDIIFLPLVILLLLTFWRAPPIFPEIRRAFDMHTKRLILLQFTRLILDIILLPALLAVLFSWYRSQQTRYALKLGASSSARAADIESQQPSSARPPDDEALLTPFHKALLPAAGFLILDILCTPMILLLTLTFYRLQYAGWGRRGVEFHQQVGIQTLEFLLDLPFLLASSIVVLTLYRADIIFSLRHANAGNAVDRRKAAGMQLMFLLRDVAMIVPSLVVAVTLYRLPSLLLGVKASLTKILLGEPEMHLIVARMPLDRPKTHPRVTFRVAKSPNLAGLTAMRLHVAGDGFWDAIIQSKGSFVASIGRAMLPLALRQGREVDLAAIRHGDSEAEISIELEQEIKTTTAEKMLRSLPPQTEMLLQLEGRLASGTEVVLLAVPVAVSDLLSGVETGEIPVQPQALDTNVARIDGLDENPNSGDRVTAERLTQLRGSLAQGCRRDKWWVPVMQEFVTILVDLFHMFLLLVLCAIPWRLAILVKRLCERSGKRSARLVRSAVAALEAWDFACDKGMALLEPLLNSSAKDAVMQLWRQSTTSAGSQKSKECCCCWENLSTSEDLIDRLASKNLPVTQKVDKVLELITSSIREWRGHLKSTRRSWPDEPEWEPIANMIDHRLKMRGEAFWWTLLLWEVNRLFASRKISRNQHARLAQGIRNVAIPLTKGFAKSHDQLRVVLEHQCNRVCSKSKKRKISKSLGFLFIREQVCKGFIDIAALFGLVLLACTAYRIPRLLEDLQGISDREQLKQVVKIQLLEELEDAVALIELVLLTILLMVTVVKFPDFLGGLSLSRGVRANRDWACLVTGILLEGICELLTLLFVWKTYKLLVHTALFALLSPAAILAVTLPKSWIRGTRFSVALLIWLAALAGNIVAAQIDTARVARPLIGIVWVLAFVGLCWNKAGGWLCPNGADDWWSPVVRFTLPNLLALVAIISDGTVLAFLAHGWTMTSTMAASILKGVCLASILHASCVIVADDADQKNILMDPVWRGMVSLLQEVMFLPVTLALSTQAKSTIGILNSICLMYYMTVALLGTSVWELSTSPTLHLDIRCVGLSSCGRRLLLAAAVIAAVSSMQSLFVALVMSAGIWTACWAWRGSSVLWTQVLQFSAIVGCVLLMKVGLFAMYITYFSGIVLAVLVMVTGCIQRRQRWSASGLPEALTRLQHIQERLCLWGDTSNSHQHVFGTTAQSAAYWLLNLEAGLPFERLSLKFMNLRQSWRRELLKSPSYETVLSKLKELQEAIHEPCTRVLLRQVLVRYKVPYGHRFPEPLVESITNFAEPRISWNPPCGTKGWEFGNLDLKQLRAKANASATQFAANLPKRKCSL